MIYSLIRFFASLLLIPIFRIEVSGIESVPETGPCIIASNHKSWLDPVFLGIVLKRKIRFMAKEELFRYPLLGWLVRELGAFPVKRGAADRQALKTAVEALKKGEAVGIFVEGTRVRTNSIGELKPGIYLLAKQTGATVLVSAIYGNYPLFKTKVPLVPNRVRISFARFNLDPREISAGDYLQKMKEELEKLWESLK
jgi:1-acyl-sn-glycerol-3-phosphate acyltransferase